MTNTLYLDISLGFENYTLNAKADIPLVGITALEGVSGSGKTSLLRAIAGLETEVKGVIRFGETPWLSERDYVSPQARRIGYVFQDTRLFKHLNVAQNLAYGHKRAGAPPEVLSRVIDALDLKNLLKRRINRLSGGEKQRVAIGRALALDPHLLLLDEPMSGLDQARKDEILPYIARAVSAMGCPAIYVSHSHRETSMLADHIMRISDGVLSGPDKCETVLHCVAKPSQEDGSMVLFIGDQETAMAVSAPQGEMCNVRIHGAGVLLTMSDPGANTAKMTLPATLASIEAVSGRGDQLRLGLEGDGWRIGITKPKSECAALDLNQGQALWVSIMDARAYPA